MAQRRRPAGFIGHGIWRLALVIVALAAPALAADDAAELEKRLAAAAGPERVELLLQLAETHLYRAPDKVVSYAQQAYDGARELSLVPASGRALLTRGTGYFQLGELDRALASYQEGLKIAESVGDHRVIGGCLNGIAVVNMKRGQPDVALAFFTQAIEHLEQADSSGRLAGVFNNVSLIYYAKGQYDMALDFMFKALRLYEGLGDEKGQGVVLNAIGNVYNKLADPVHAREHFERALAIAEKTDHKQLMTGCLVNIAEIYNKQHDWDQALAYLNRALPIARRLASADYISVCLNNIGDILRDKGQPEEALRFYLESMRMFEAMSARPRLAVSYVNIGRLYLSSARLTDAESYLLKGLALAREVEELTLQKDAAEALFALYETRGEYRKAFEYQRIFNDLKERIFSRENFEKITTLQAKYESEKQERAIELLRKEREIQELEVKRQRLWLVLIASGLVVIAALAVVLYKRYRLKARTNAELASAYGRMAELASRDELTGLYNRRSASERLEIEMVRTSRTHRPFALVMVDVDDFKKVNDECGHECGDAVLRAMAALLSDAVRDLDVVARWGGEEFLIILPETSRGGAALLAEKLRQSVAALAVEHEGRQVRVTVTLGVNVYDRLGTVSESLRGADEALYEGKRAGKNRVVLATA